MKVKQDCGVCRGYCCTMVGPVELREEDVSNLAKFLSVSAEEIKEQFVVTIGETKILKKVDDALFGVCPFQAKTGKCSVYGGRPLACRQYNCWEKDDVMYDMKPNLDKVSQETVLLFFQDLSVSFNEKREELIKYLQTRKIG